MGQQLNGQCIKFLNLNELNTIPFCTENSSVYTGTYKTVGKLSDLRTICSEVTREDFYVSDHLVMMPRYAYVNRLFKGPHGRLNSMKSL
ncbi:hypothetical protein CDAR_127761 [Caerostris darwini]|uniref:Uncharacterized protein n=1 Tax=Caerostris darwini TaxID=1538125 RepID=A0AAV4NY42_9ARAC|nr:hypothetical protein CDAR_127761 [Caerostris darwini]